MIFYFRKPLFLRQLISVLLVVSVTATVFAESVSNHKDKTLDVRVDRLERLVGSQKQLEFLNRLKQLQDENQQLRSMLEEQNNEIHQLKQQQRELYADLNRRLNQMEGGNEQYSLMNPEKPASVQVIDKSSVKTSDYGVTERKVVIVDETKNSNASQPSSTRAIVNKPPVATIKPMSEKERKAEQKAYQKSYDELTARQYNKSRESFIEFIQQYPSGRYAHIAQYWIAESSYAQGNYEQAILDYQLLLDVYPFSPKKAEAELKKSYSYFELGDKKNARRTLDYLLINYPDTTEAGQAKRLLKKL